MAGLWLDSPGHSAAVQENMLVNPGFEAGAEGWTANPSTAHFEIVSAPTHIGTQAAAVTKQQARGLAFIYQEVAVVAGEHYSASVWAVWESDLLSNVRLRVEWFDAGETRLQLDEASLAERSSSYQELNLENLQAPVGAVTARVEGYTFVGTGGSTEPAYFDDFHFGPSDGVSVGATGTPDPLATATAPVGVAPSPTAMPTATSIPISAGAIVINEVYYDPATPGGDPGDEWAELFNTTDHAINLAGWSLADGVSADELPDVEIVPRGFVIVAASETFRAQFTPNDAPLITLNAPIGNGLRNAGDSLRLLDPQGQTIDALSYGDDESVMRPAIPSIPEGQSLERIPAGRDTDTAADWFPQAAPSPGTGVGFWRQYLPLIRVTGE